MSRGNPPLYIRVFLLQCGTELELNINRESLMTIVKCDPPRCVPAGDLETIGKLYPYDIWYYRDLNAEARAFLTREFSTLPHDTEVIGISNHNGCGFQWGIILLRRPREENWGLVAQFGHGVRIPFTHWTMDWQRFWPIRLAAMRHARWISYRNHHVKEPRSLYKLI